MEELTSVEVTYWRAYYEMFPLGPQQDDYRTGILAHLLANVINSWGGDVESNPAKYFPSLKPLFKNYGVQTPEQLHASLLQWAYATHAEFVTEDDR